VPRRPPEQLVQCARDGDVAAIAQLITLVESAPGEVEAVLPELYGAGGRAHVVGITGSPGSGKSTLVNALVAEERRRGRTIAVVAVDPSSSFTGGAILGDRIRMQEHALDRGVFVRSMSSRGALGGLSRAAVDAVAVLDASGFDVVVVETVGAGQSEIEIVRTAQTIVLVSVPGMGDDIQTIKAGVMEIADVHAVNKADRAETHKTVRELRGMLRLGPDHDDRGWRTPIVETVAPEGRGVGELVDAIEAHRAWLESSGELAERERTAARVRLTALAKELLMQQLSEPAGGAVLEQAVDDVSSRRLDPRTAARDLIRELVT
jgi:LAO/AO transport system kinase